VLSLSPLAASGSRQTTLRERPVLGGFTKEFTMVRHSVAVLAVLMILVSATLAKDADVKGKVVKVDVKAKTLTVQTDDGKKVYMVNDETKFLGPKGGVSDAGLKDDRLVPGAELKLVIAGNNRTVREVHLPERKKASGK
jgi:hypothetical protein